MTMFTEELPWLKGADLEKVMGAGRGRSGWAGSGRARNRRPSAQDAYPGPTPSGQGGPFSSTTFPSGSET